MLSGLKMHISRVILDPETIEIKMKMKLAFFTVLPQMFVPQQGLLSKGWLVHDSVVNNGRLTTVMQLPYTMQYLMPLP